MQLSEIRAVVSGGASGLGLGVCTSIVQAGGKVTILDISEAQGNAAVAALGPRAFFARTDVETLRYEDSLEAINATTHPYHGLYLSGLRILHEYLQLQKRTSAANT